MIFHLFHNIVLLEYYNADLSVKQLVHFKKLHFLKQINNTDNRVIDVQMLMTKKKVVNTYSF